MNEKAEKEYADLLADITLDPSQKMYRRIADMIADILDDETGGIAMDIASQYYKDEEVLYSDHFQEFFMIPLQEKCMDAVMENLGYRNPPQESI
jgi:hypothetical protein